jgi:hypothetical protein
MATAPSNPYYQRAFNAIAGSLARARSAVNEFILIQRGFDLIGDFTGATKYQLSCSDLTSDLEVTPEAAYFRVQRELTLLEVRASLLEPSVSGAVTIDMTVNGVPLLAVPITIDQGEETSTTAAVPAELAITSIPDDAEIVVSITTAGAGAKGLIVSLLGRISVLLSTP